jgi:hypothetical protein
VQASAEIAAMEGQGQLFEEFRTQEGNAGQPNPQPALRHAPASDLVAVGGWGIRRVGR